MRAFRLLWRLVPWLLSVILLPAAAFGQVMPDQGLQCRAAVEAAERAHGIPSRLLAAIARVESGRRDPVTGNWNPWPWTVNADGAGFFYDTKAQAVAAVRGMQASGVRSIDVGCMQISLLHHPDAFASLEEAFDPMRNAAYGARFLVQLFDQSGAWPQAAALYHSATPEIGAAYQRQVMAAWPEEQRWSGGPAIPLQTAWAATLGGGTLHPLAMPPIRRAQTARFQPPGGAAGNPVPPGRDLASYRASPVTWALRPLRRPG